jgi:hypothetical protein
MRGTPMTDTSRRAVMKAFGEYVDFCMWLRNAKNGIDVDQEDPSTADLAQMTKAADERWHMKLNQYLGYTDD